MQFGFSIACGGHEDLLLACVESIRRNCLTDVTVAVTFDGFVADEDITDKLESLNCLYDTFEKRQGISRTWNNGIEMCWSRGADLVCVLNDDTEIGTGGFDSDYIGFYERNHDTKIVCSLDRLTAHSVIPRITKAYSESWARDRLPPDTNLVDAIYHGGFEAEIGRFRNDTHPEFARCRMNGACFVMSKQAIEELGLFDENFVPPGCCEDMDMWLRCLTRFGPNSMGTFTRSFIHHIRSATISNYPRDWANQQIKKNSNLYRSKWPREKYAAIEDWFSTVNALPVGADEPPFPGIPQ